METLKKQQLFWDVDLEKLDSQANKEFVIMRILSEGDAADFHWAENFYGKDLLKKVFKKNIQKLNRKSCNFWRLYFNIDVALCTAKQLTQKRSAFWTR